MTEKLKVNKNVAEALTSLLSRDRKEYSFEWILEMHSKTLLGQVMGWKGENWSYLNELSLSEMAQAIYVGYEIEETKEEKVLAIYSRFGDTTAWTYSGKSARKAIVEILDLLEVDIVGVNTLESVFD